MMHPILRSHNLFLVDMDDTLYEERDFVMSGFRAVARHVAQWGVDVDTAWTLLRQRFISQGREGIFDDLLATCLGSAPPDQIEKLVCVYREHTPTISLYSGAAEVLLQLRQCGRVLIVTDGLPAVQKRKVLALGLRQYCDDVIYCWERNAPKPDPRSLAGLVEQGDTRTLLIGDDPDRDMMLAENLGIAAIRVRSGRFRDKPVTTRTSVDEVDSFAMLHRNALSRDDLCLR